MSGAEPAGSYPPYDRGLEMDVFLKNASGGVFVGRVWNPVSTVWPDFTHPKAQQYWTEMFRQFREKVGILSRGLYKYSAFQNILYVPVERAVLVAKEKLKNP